MANQVTLKFAGDADQLAKEAKKAEQSAKGVGDAAIESSKGMETAAKSSGDLGGRLSNLGNIVDGASTAIGDAAGTLQAFVDIQDAARQKNQRLQQALNDVAQAQEDYNQAVLDGKQATADATQAGIDARQAQLDARTAQLDYDAAVKEHGKNSVEAEQAAIDLQQAQADLNQANLDGEQATRDATQSVIDAKQAQIDLNDAQAEANPPDIAGWADALNTYAPLLQGLVGIIGLVTAAQWLWNAAQLASPLTWIIIAVGALIAAIVLIATKTTWFQDIWAAAWGWIKDAAAAVWDWIGDKFEWFNSVLLNIGKVIRQHFGAAWDWVKNTAVGVWNWFADLPNKFWNMMRSVGDSIVGVFKWAFNFVADIWNNTVGRISIDIPGWVPVIGGKTFSAPKIPKFHDGGTVPGAPGQEMLAILQAGETVTSASRSNQPSGTTITFAGDTNSAFATAFMNLVRTGQIQIGGA